MLANTITKLAPATLSRYRPDVDGLRGIAILSVVLYHAGIPFVPGGFVGVDVFFVISGYLITGILLREIADFNFSLSNFYLRRAKRILPALTVVIAVTWVLGYWLMLPNEFSDLGQEIGYSAIFIVNIFFKREQASYFHTAAELKPLLHLWSLSIEEQFYLFWPLLLILATRFTRQVRWLIMSVLLLSFAASCWELIIGNFKSAFYLLPFRAWELAIGAWAAILEIENRGIEPPRLIVRHVASVAGMLLILFGIFTLKQSAPFPGWNALSPTIGAALLIWARPDALANRAILSRRALVGLGLVSYSLYLWHWPLLAMIRVVLMGSLPSVWAGVAVIAALGLSILSWRYVEQPIRHWKPTGTMWRTPLRQLVPFGAAIVLTFSLGLITHIERGLDSRFSAKTIAAVNEAKPVNIADACMLTVENGRLQASPQCSGIGLSKRSVAVWGDSHAKHYFPGVKRYLQRYGIEPVLIAFDGCPPLLGVERVDDDRRCAANSKRVFDYLIRTPAISTVIFAARFVGYAEPHPFGLDSADPIRLVALDGKLRGSQEALVAEAMNDTINKLTAAGKKVVVMGEVPQQIFDESQCHARKAMWPTVEQGLDCDIPADVYQRRSNFINVALEHIGTSSDNICVFRPDRYLCTASKCISEVDGHSIYQDSSHLNERGSIFIAQFFNFGRCLPSR